MPFYIGNDKIDNIYIGNDKIDKIYIGSSLVYSAYSEFLIWNYGAADYTGNWTNLKNSGIEGSEIKVGTDGTIYTAAKISTEGYKYICTWARVNKYYDGVYDIGIWSNEPSNSIPSGGWSSGYATHIKGTSPTSGGNDQYRAYILPIENYQGNYYYVYGLRGFGSEYANMIVCDNDINKISISATGNNISYEFTNGGHTLTVTRSAAGAESATTVNSFVLTALADCKISLSYTQTGWDNYNVTNELAANNGIEFLADNTLSFSLTSKARNSSSIAKWVFNII